MFKSFVFYLKKTSLCLNLFHLNFSGEFVLNNKITMSRRLKNLAHKPLLDSSARKQCGKEKDAIV